MILIKDYMSTEVVRTDKGQFVQGASGNPAGRPRKADIVDLKHAAEVAIREHVDVKALKKIVDRMVRIAITSPDEKEAIKASKLLLESFLSKARDGEDTPESARTFVFKIQNALIDTTQGNPDVINVVPIIEDK